MNDCNSASGLYGLHYSIMNCIGSQSCSIKHSNAIKCHLMCILRKFMWNKYIVLLNRQFSIYHENTPCKKCTHFVLYSSFLPHNSLQGYEESKRVETKNSNKLALKKIQALEAALEDAETVSYTNTCTFS